MSKTPLTVKGAESLRAELQRLKTVDRHSVIAAIAEARSHGDLSENAEYDAAKERQSFIEGRIAELAAESAYTQLLLGATRLFATSFFLSSLMNLGLAQWFFRGFDAQAVDALEVYNGIIAKITGWGFAVIGLPILIFLFF